MSESRQCSVLNDRKIAPGYQEPYRAIVRLLGEDGRLDCTGVVIANNKVLTAGHCVKMNGKFKQSHELPQFVEAFNGEKFEVVRWCTAPDYVGELVKHPTLHWAYAGYSEVSDDVAILTLRRNISATTGVARVWYGLSADEEVLMAGFHSDAPKTLKAQRCEARVFDSYIGSDRLEYYCDTAHGSSGSPIFVEREGQYVVVGLHVASNPDDVAVGALLGAHRRVVSFVEKASENAFSTTAARPTGSLDRRDLPRSYNGMLI